MSDISKKVDVGFTKPVEVIGQAMTGQPMLRLEALKLAYEVAFRQDIFNRREWDGKSLEDQVDSYKQVFELADINYQFLTVGKVDIPVISSLDDDDAK